jgi:hypothetical protein
MPADSSDAQGLRMAVEDLVVKIKDAEEEQRFPGVKVLDVSPGLEGTEEGKRRCMFGGVSFSPFSSCASVCAIMKAGQPAARPTLAQLEAEPASANPFGNPPVSAAAAAVARAPAANDVTTLVRKKRATLEPVTADSAEKRPRVE